MSRKRKSESDESTVVVRGEITGHTKTVFNHLKASLLKEIHEHLADPITRPLVVIEGSTNACLLMIKFRGMTRRVFDELFPHLEGQTIRDPKQIAAMLGVDNAVVDNIKCESKSKSTEHRATYSVRICSAKLYHDNDNNICTLFVDVQRIK